MEKKVQILTIHLYDLRGSEILRDYIVYTLPILFDNSLYFYY